MNTLRFPMKAARFAICALLSLTAPQMLIAGAYAGVNTSDPNRVEHPIGYTGIGGTLEVSVCIDPSSLDASNVSDLNDLVIPVLNSIDTWNALTPSLPNLLLSGDNNIPSGRLDWETTIVHEVGHCLGLAHPNAASESDVPAADEEHTRATRGTNGTFDMHPGLDGVRGSSDDLRGDDVNLHWFVKGINNPYFLPATVDRFTYTRDVADLPLGHNFVANAARNVGELLGLDNSEAVMQQGARTDEDQRQLAPDDVATIRFAESGVDETAGTADDYDLVLTYAGITSSCDIRIQMAGTGFASCSSGSTTISGSHRRLTSARVRTSPTTDWFYNQTRPTPLPVLVVTKTASQDSVPEPGAEVIFTVRVDNTPIQGVTLLALADTVHGNLSGQGTCVIPRAIAAGASYECSFAATVTGNSGDVETGTVTAIGLGSSIPLTAAASGSAAVSITDVLPSIGVTKTASPTSVPEPGGNVTFTVRVANTSVEAVSLTSVEDDVYGDLAGQGTCGEVSVAAGSVYQCSFMAHVAGDPGDNLISTVSVIASDDEGNLTMGEDAVAVSITNAEPLIDVTQTVSPTSIPESGGSVTYTVRVDNLSAESVTLTSVVDEFFGELIGEGTCSEDSIAAGGSYECSFTSMLSGNAGDSVVTTVTATVVDDEGSMDSDNDSATVTVTDVAPSIAVTKTASATSVPEPGALVMFTVRVDNTSVETVTLTTLVDDVHGNLNGQGNCSTPRPISEGIAYTCTYTVAVDGNAGDSESGTATATVTDDEDNEISDSDAATVSISNVEPMISVIKTASPTSVPEPGGPVTFSVQVDNTSVETVSLTALTDETLGDLDGEGNCALPQSIAAGGMYHCSFTRNVSGNAGHSETDTVTATVVDDEGSMDSDNDSATVTVTDVAPSIAVTTTASPTSVPEPGAPVTFTVRVDSTSVENLDLTTLTGGIHGDLNGQGDCAIPQSIAVGAFYQCSFTANVSGNAGDSVTDTVTAIANDDEGGMDSSDDSATVTFTDVLPSITVTTTAAPTTVSEPGGPVKFMVRVDNTSVESVDLTALADVLLGDLNGQGDCATPQSIAVGGAYQCSFTANVSGNAGDSETNTVTATSNDDEGNGAMDSESATVDIVEGMDEADLSITKVATPAPVISGTNLVYPIIVTNNGPDDAENVEVADALPGQVTLVSTSGCAEDPSGVPTCSLGTVAASTSRQILVTVTVDSAFEGLLTSTASVTSSTAEANPGDETATVTVEAIDATNLLFVDGFESGNLSSWASSSP